MIKKTQLPRLSILLLGLILLVFTFINAYLFLRYDLNIVFTSSLVDFFGEALAPLVEACIRVMYLAVMGWVGSIVTIRGVQLYSQKSTKKPEKAPEVKS